MAYQINLEKFEGPFDLLLYLIQKNKIDIYDIPIAEITGQYLSTIRHWQELDLEVASEFITMAARLMEIKSSMLLPAKPAVSEEEADPKIQLAAQLIEYQTFKSIGHYFQERETEELGAVFKEPEYLPELEQDQEIEILPEVLSGILKKMIDFYRDDHEYKKYSGEIKRDIFRVEDKVNAILLYLERSGADGFEFSEVLTAHVVQEVVVAFQALLECYKNGVLCVRQNALYGKIMIYSARTGRDEWKQQS